MDQHFIPRVYLKNFENSRRLLYSVPKHIKGDNPKIKEFSRAQVGYLPDFYTIKKQSTLERLNLSDADAIERNFNKRVEDQYERLLRLIVSRQATITHQQAQDLAFTLLSFKQRNPTFRLG